MLLNLTEEQIIQLAPDAASVKAGKGLATRAKWVLLEHSDRAICGHCQGSGKTPYQTVIDTKNVAFKCSCPSRKFPCKHGLGLLFLYAAQAEQFKEADEPEWVTSWLSKREEKAEKKEQKPFGGEDGVRRILAVSSAKGGVGKSTVTANLAVALSRLGYKVGILDADIYGPSQPMLFGVEDYRPEGEKKDGKDWILPAERFGIRIMSIGFFIDPADALMWRGPMATNALRQMIRQTLWGPLDFLLIDLPPGTGDVHLSIISEMSITGAIVVSTPQKVALADVVRGIAMFRNDKIDIPVLGLVENMAWFTPAELPENRYYLFGKEGVKMLAERQKLPLLAQIPLIQSVRESGDAGRPVSAKTDTASEYYDLLANNIVRELP